MAVQQSNTGILADENRDKREEVVELLTTAYWMEIETVMNYIACSVNPDGLLAREIVESLAQDVTEELGHAQQFAERIKELYGVVPGSRSSTPRSRSCSPPTPDRHHTRVAA